LKTGSFDNEQTSCDKMKGHFMITPPRKYQPPTKAILPGPFSGFQTTIPGVR
jgi:hypothetical protein